MRQRSARQKFHDLRSLTFQDWILPRSRPNNHQRKASEIMKNSRLPVFSYTKMDNGPPLSPISSQFAWADHALPDLVQEQSERLLRRLERPKTADNRGPNHKHSLIKGGKLTRPSTAVPVRIRTIPTTRFHVNGTKYDATTMAALNKTYPLEAMQNLLPTHEKSHGTPSPISERSSSPDFIANLYKEYENKLSCDDDKETVSETIEISCTTSPTPKLLRRPSVQFRLHMHNNKGPKRKSSSSQTSPTKTDNIVHCVVKLPSYQTNDHSNGYNMQAKTKLSKPETWIDLSELCQPSDDEIPVTSSTDEEGLHRSSIASESGSTPQLLDLLNGVGDELMLDKDGRKSKVKIARPCSSKIPKKPRPKSRMKRKRPISAAQAEESTKELIKESSKSPDTSCRRGRSCDKLREEIETQMSKLDFQNSARQKRDPLVENLPPVNEVTQPPKLNVTHIPQMKHTTWKAIRITKDVPNFRCSVPLKKVPIQILSDPFSTSIKIYENGK